MRNFAVTLIMVASLVGLLSSCSVQQMNNYHCKRCPTKDSVRVERERFDSLVIKEITDTIPGDTIRDTIKVPCKDFKYQKENKRQKVRIEVKDGELAYEGICKEWEFKYKVSEWHHTLVEKTFVQKTVTIYEGKNKSGFARFIQRWFGWLGYWQSWVCIGYFAFRLIRWILKLTGKWPFPISIKRSG